MLILLFLDDIFIGIIGSIVKTENVVFTIPNFYGVSSLRNCNPEYGYNQTTGIKEPVATNLKVRCSNYIVLWPCGVKYRVSSCVKYNKY